MEREGRNVPKFMVPYSQRESAKNIGACLFADVINNEWPLDNYSKSTQVIKNVSQFQ